MRTWFPVSAAEADPLPDFRITASHCYERDSPEAAVDGVLPEGSHDLALIHLSETTRPY